MEFLVTATNAVSFSNKELQKSTDFIFKLGDSIKKNWFAIAYTVAHVDATECYKDDGFNTVHEWVEKAFGIKKSASYSLLTIGKEYTRRIVNASGKTTGYGSNLIAEGSVNDFSKTQIEKMLPAGHELAVELVINGEITPDMSAKEISRVVKSHVDPEPEQEMKPEQESETDEDDGEPETEVDTITLWDSDGNEYVLPINIVKKYAL